MATVPRQSEEAHFVSQHPSATERLIGLDVVGRGRVENQASHILTTGVAAAADDIALTLKAPSHGKCAALEEAGTEGTGTYVWNTSKATAKVLSHIPLLEGYTYATNVETLEVDGETIAAISSRICEDLDCATGAIGVPACPEQGIDLYSLKDPTAPVHLGHLTLQAVNKVQRGQWNGNDIPATALAMYNQLGRSFLAVSASYDPRLGPMFGGLQIFDITNLKAPVPVGFWGVESIYFPVDDIVNVSPEDTNSLFYQMYTHLAGGQGESLGHTCQSIAIHRGLEASSGRELTQAVLSCGDSGVLHLDITDPAAIRLTKQLTNYGESAHETNALKAVSSSDGEVTVELAGRAIKQKELITLTDHDTNVSDALYASFTLPPLNSFGAGGVVGTTYYVGQACTDTVPRAASPDDIALIMRGPKTCTFANKITNAKLAGYGACIVFNTEEGSETLVKMVAAMDKEKDIPAVFVGHSDGLKLAKVASLDELPGTVVTTGDDTTPVADVRVEGEPVRIWLSTESHKAGGVRIWATPPAEEGAVVPNSLASVWQTACNANPLIDSCTQGDFEPTDVAIETVGDEHFAIISYGTDGLVVLDVTDPYNPKETKRYTEATTHFHEQNGGRQDFSAVAQLPGSDKIYAADASGDLYVLKPGSGLGVFALEEQLAAERAALRALEKKEQNITGLVVAVVVLLAFLLVASLGCLVLRRRRRRATAGDDTGANAPGIKMIDSYRGEDDDLDFTRTARNMHPAPLV